MSHLEGTSNSLFGDDLYEYSLSKHNRPPLKLYLGTRGLHAVSLGTKGRSPWGLVLAILTVCERSFEFSIYTQGSLSKGQSFSLEASGVPLEFSWGSLFLCEKLPSRSTRNSPNPVLGYRFSGAVPCLFLSGDWRGSDILAML
jgi:hypothetical protein